MIVGFQRPREHLADLAAAPQSLHRPREADGDRVGGAQGLGRTGTACSTTNRTFYLMFRSDLMSNMLCEQHKNVQGAKVI